MFIFLHIKIFVKKFKIQVKKHNQILIGIRLKSKKNAVHKKLLTFAGPPLETAPKPNFGESPLLGYTVVQCQLYTSREEEAGIEVPI